MFSNSDTRFPVDSPHSFDNTITYLQNSDFDESGKMITDVGNKRVAILIQSHQCGFCKPVKDCWQRIANEKFEKDGDVLMCTIDAYENTNLLRRINKFIPEFKGFPFITAYQNGILTDTYSGDRKYDSILKFCDKKISTIM